MLKNKPLEAWKRKKVEVEARIKELERIRSETVSWLERASSRRTEMLWRRTEYLRFIQKQQRLDAVIRETATKLAQAKIDLAEIKNAINQLEKNHTRTLFTAGGIVAVLLLIFALFNYSMFVGDFSLTGAVVSLPEPIESGDSADAIEVPIETPIETPIEVPTPPREENIPPQDPPKIEPEPTPEPIPEPIKEKEEGEHGITIPDLPAEDNTSYLDLNSSETNSTLINDSINASLEAQIIPADVSPLAHTLTRFSFRHSFGVQGATLESNGNNSNGNIITSRSIVNPLQPGTNNVNSTPYRANIGFLRNVNTTVKSTAAADTTAPNVTNMTPALNSRFNFSASIEISANVTDSTAVSAVNVTILLPNGSITPLTLSTTVLNGKYNTSYTIPNLTGLYNVTFGANDSLNNINSTEFTNFTAVNAAPVVYWVVPVHSQSITEGSIAQIVNISFNVSDVNGKDDIDNSSAQIRISLTGETDRSNTSCTSGASTSTTIQFNCTIGIWYFDGAGSWTINVSVRDKSSAYAENRSTTFELLSTTAMAMSPNTLTWATLELGRTNQTSNNDPIRINNTGNKNIAVGGITVTGYNLQGITTLTDFINAENFSIFPVNNTGSGGPIECNGTQMFNGTSGAAAPQTISIANITRGNNTIDDGTSASGQEELFVCLRFVPLGITRQSYDTSGLSTGPWTIAVS